MQQFYHVLHVAVIECNKDIFYINVLIESCCKSIEEIETVDDKISDHGKNTSINSLNCTMTFDCILKCLFETTTPRYLKFPL